MAGHGLGADVQFSIGKVPVPGTYRQVFGTAGSTNSDYVMNQLLTVHLNGTIPRGELRGVLEGQDIDLVDPQV
ncbi:hypothetical protein ColTof4_01168 [Colletotrichum tofieldiae]|nr:hypothetical protein ColTof3_08396 [Colletotrichum tofieldiae]GKT68745.1 hypothetical protein ColTof4_01168 [Colletotrichum tofieldiae]